MQSEQGQSVREEPTSALRSDYLRNRTNRTLSRVGESIQIFGPAALVLDYILCMETVFTVCKCYRHYYVVGVHNCTLPETTSTSSW
jgi:hypothetical protein